MADSLAISALGQDSLALQKNYSDYAQYLAMMQGAQATQNTLQVSPTFTSRSTGGDPVQRAPEVKNYNTTAAVILTGLGIALTGAAACISKGKAAGAEGNWNKIITGLKEYGKIVKGWFSGGAKKAASETADVTAAGAGRSVSNLINGSNLQEYTIQHGVNQYVMRGGKPVRIIEGNSRVIDKADDITNWMTSNPSAQKEINNLIGKLNSTRVLPSGTSLAYMKEITQGGKSYKVFVENGQVVKVMGKDKAGAFHEVKDLDAFIKNNGAVVKEAKTLTQTLSGQKVKILNKKGNLVEQTGNLNISTRDGKIVSAKFNGKDLKPEELAELQKNYNPSQIENLTRNTGDKYEGLSSFEYIYRQKGGQEFRFDVTGTPTRINAINTVEHTSDKAIKKFLEDNKNIQEELNKIASEGTISNGFNLRNAVYKTEAGNLCRINGKNIEAITLTKDVTIKGKTFKAGDEITGKYLKEWQKDASNSHDIEKILELLK